MVLTGGICLINYIRKHDPNFFAFGDSILFNIGTALLLAYLFLSAAAKAASVFGKFYWWLPMGSFIVLMLFLINFIPIRIFAPSPPDSAATGFTGYFLLLLSVWLVCDVFTFAYVYPDKNK